MKWYFCLNEAGLMGLGETALVAANSCIKNTSLEPHFIYSGPRNAFSEYMEHIGVTVHYQQLSFLQDLMNATWHPDFSIYSATGAYLRYEIPNIDPSDDVILYTDADVIFCRDIPDIQRPKLFAAAPEYAKSYNPPIPVSTVLNSGVMLINLDAYRRELGGLLQCCRENDFYFHGVGGFYDQGALNIHFAGQWEELPQHMNWRPYVKDQPPPTIIHFHGTKPHDIVDLIETGKTLRVDGEKLYNLAPENYHRTLDLFRKYVDPKGVEALLESNRTAVLSGCVERAPHNLFS